MSTILVDTNHIANMKNTIECFSVFVFQNNLCHPIYLHIFQYLLVPEVPGGVGTGAAGRLCT